MTSKLRIEYVRPRGKGGGPTDVDVIQDVVGQSETLSVGGVSVQSAVAPDFGPEGGLHGGVYARLSCVSGAVILTEAADNPIATQTAGLRLGAEDPAILQPVKKGERFAAIEAADRALTFEPGNLPQVLAYDGDKLSTVTVTDGVDTWVQTFSYTGANLTGVSAWVRQ